MRFQITLSYDGSAFNGWQIQPTAPSVQETLQKALSTILRTDVAVTGAGRTDTGVNAINYVAHFDLVTGIDVAEIGYKLNAILPHAVVIHSVKVQKDDFHARFGAQKREYTYFLHRKKDPFVEKFSYQCTFPLDFEAMNKAAKALLGTHDFSCFEKVGADNKTSICTVTEAGWSQYDPTHVALMGYPSDGNYWYFRISADRFLRNMVRAITGTLIEVGRGKRSVESFESLILPADASQSREKDIPMRSNAGESAPGHALFLSKVEY